LIKGNLTAADYEDERRPGTAHRRAARPDGLHREQAVLGDYLDPKKRSIANQLQIFFKNGTRRAKWR